LPIAVEPPTELPQTRGAPAAEELNEPPTDEFSTSTFAPDLIVSDPVVVALVMTVVPDESVTEPLTVPVIVAPAVTV
jgi:hypothetical protein